MRQLRSGALTQEHDLGLFKSGRPPLDLWLRCEAWRAQASGTARTYVWTTDGSPIVGAYYSVTPTSVQRGEVSKSLEGGVSTVPAFLLARLALDESLQGKGLGPELLIDALEVIVDAARLASGRLIIVDALDRAAHDFYVRHDFVPVGGNRLAMKVRTAEAALKRPKS